MKRVAVVYHYLALYRLPIFQELMKSKDCKYTIFSGKESDISIKKIPVGISQKDICNGGLRWRFLVNKWRFNKKFLWQEGLLNEILRDKHEVYIFLGSPYHLSTWLGAVLARLKKREVYYWMHGIYKEKLQLLDYLKLFFFYRIANGFFLYSNRSALVLQKFYKKKHTEIVYNSLNYDVSVVKRLKVIDTEKIYNLRENYFRDKTIPVVAFIGRVNYIKRIDLLIEAQRLLRDKYNKPIFNMLIIGDGEELAKLKEEAQSYNLNKNIYFCGAIYKEEEIADLMMFCDLCVVPGEVGLTAIHALSYGTPVISHDNFNIQMPEVESIIPNVTGDFYRFGDVDSLADKIYYWLKRFPCKNNEILYNCYKIIDDFYNPHYQSMVFDRVLKD